MSRVQGSLDSLTDASRERARFSGHGNAKGAAGLVPAGKTGPDGFLSAPGDAAIVNPRKHGFRPIKIGMGWSNGAGGRHGSVDLDLGCLYELQGGERGTIQAFGDRYGAFDTRPYITLSGDARTGEALENDEFLVVNGLKWPEIKRLLLYAYIYRGAPDWSAVKPLVHVRVPGEPELTIVPAVKDAGLAVCAVASLENIRNGIKITNHTEYFAGHAEMDRAFGFGLSWENGGKS